MSEKQDFLEGALFEVLAPQDLTSALVLNSPHSGRQYPAAFVSQSRLTAEALRRSEDCFVDELFAHCVNLGAPMLCANFPRAYIDVNREPFELDPKMYIEALPSYVNSQSPRVCGGLGTIPRIVGDGLEIYRHRFSFSEALHRIETVYRPYHKALRDLLSRTHSHFGQACLLDCHSMPSTIRLGERGVRPDFIIGDRFGTSASRDLCQVAIYLLQAQGFVVAHNKPYAGGFITEHYGRPSRGLHAIQIEVNRGLYLDEQNFRKSAGFGSLKQTIDLFLEEFAAMIDAAALKPPLAAE